MKSWGSEVIPQSKWIDTTKETKTKDGRRVFGLTKKMLNSCGNEVTFPIKGSIDNGVRKAPTYMVWTLDGRTYLDRMSEMDLVQE